MIYTLGHSISFNTVVTSTADISVLQSVNCTPWFKWYLLKLCIENSCWHTNYAHTLTHSSHMLLTYHSKAELCEQCIPTKFIVLIWFHNLFVPHVYNWFTTTFLPVSLLIHFQFCIVQYHSMHIIKKFSFHMYKIHVRNIYFSHYST